MVVIPGTTFDLIRKLSLTSAEVSAFVGGFLPMLPDKMDDNSRGLLREGLAKILAIGVKEPVAKISYATLLAVLNQVDPESLKVKYAQQRGVQVQVKRDMDVIAGRWDTLRRRTRVANALVQYQRTKGIKASELAGRLKINSTGYLSYLMTLRRSVTSLDLAGRIEALTGLPVADFLCASRGGYRRNRPAKDDYADLLGRRRVRQIVQELQSLSDSDLDSIRALVRSLAGRKTDRP